jgi:hypothetical protein
MLLRCTGREKLQSDAPREERVHGGDDDPCAAATERVLGPIFPRDQRAGRDTEGGL